MKALLIVLLVVLAGCDICRTNDPEVAKAFIEAQWKIKAQEPDTMAAFYKMKYEAWRSEAEKMHKLYEKERDRAESWKRECGKRVDPHKSGKFTMPKNWTEDSLDVWLDDMQKMLKREYKR